VSLFCFPSTRTNRRGLEWGLQQQLLQQLQQQLQQGVTWVHKHKW